MESDYDKLTKALSDQGFGVWFTGLGWVHIEKDGVPMVILFKHDDIAVRQAIRKLRQIGFVWPPPRE